MTRSVDYLIVGQGLAGSVLSYILLKEGRRIAVFDEKKEYSSSRVAAGLFNPITGRKMVKTWNADKIFPLIQPFYRELEEWSEGRFLHLTRIYRPFTGIEEQNEWQAKSSDPNFSKYIGTLHVKSRDKRLKDTFGGIELEPSGYVDLPQLIHAVGKRLTEQESLINGRLEETEIKIEQGCVHYGGIEAGKIVFCTGIDPVSYFDWLPFRPVKGEILELSGHFWNQGIVNRGVFVLPKGNNKYRLGSTYSRKDLTTDLTPYGKKYLLEKLRKLTTMDLEFTGGLAGIRPATADRRPFIGTHPEKSELCIFNGFGTKGVSLTPYYGRQFFDYLENGKELDSEANINRYFSLI